MLVKKELLTIPTKEPSVQFVDLPKSGRVLAVYCDERGKHPVRFFSDGKNYTFLSMHITKFNTYCCCILKTSA